MSECAIYRYVYNDRVIYVGKTDHNLENRIKCHEKEEKFQPYLKKSKIEYFRVNNPAETTFWETYLINKYHGILNDAANYSDTCLPEIQIPRWHLYSEYTVQKDDAQLKKTTRRHKNKIHDHEIAIIKTSKFWLSAAHFNTALDKAVFAEYLHIIIKNPDVISNQEISIPIFDSENLKNFQLQDIKTYCEDNGESPIKCFYMHLRSGGWGGAVAYFPLEIRNNCLILQCYNWMRLAADIGIKDDILKYFQQMRS